MYFLSPDVCTSKGGIVRDGFCKCGPLGTLPYKTGPVQCLQTAATDLQALCPDNMALNFSGFCTPCPNNTCQSPQGGVVGAKKICGPNAQLDIQAGSNSFKCVCFASHIINPIRFGCIEAAKCIAPTMLATGIAFAAGDLCVCQHDVYPVFKLGYNSCTKEVDGLIVDLMVKTKTKINGPEKWKGVQEK